MHAQLVHDGTDSVPSYNGVCLAAGHLAKATGTCELSA